MTNDKNNTKLLVTADDDPTAEFEALDLPQQHDDDQSEASATTTGFAQRSSLPQAAQTSVTDLESDVLSRSETVDRLRFEMELLSAKWQGLSTEIEAREEQANRLNYELKIATQALQRNEKRIAERDAEIDALRSTVENREAAYQSLTDELEQLHEQIASTAPNEKQQKDQLLAVQAGQIASKDLEIRELRARVNQIEDYADQLRYQLRLKDSATSEFGGELEVVSNQLQEASEQNEAMRAELRKVREKNAGLESSIAALHSTHAEEIRTIRFELGDAQETLTQHELVAERLASDLVQTRGKRQELETQLADTLENTQAKIKDLERENRQLRKDSDAMTDKLKSKSEAINCLLAELAKSPQQDDPVTEIEDAIQEIDARMSERVDDHTLTERDRVTRLLTGHIEGQKLRFPLFKDRLTIGRTSKNDIQLKSKHVSRRHAVVVIEGDVTRLIDWGSKNGVFVNSRPVKEHFLKSGDVVGVGTAEFRYEERPKRDN